jgi:D-alanyl-D-alanine carboxypeptidase
MSRSGSIRRIAVAMIAFSILAPAESAPAQTGRGGASSELRAALDTIARRPVERGLLAGVSVAVATGDEILLLAGYGQERLDPDVRASPETVYETGSLTKQFTSAAILKLAEENRLHLDDSVLEHLPDYPGEWEPITIRHLLNHTSGIEGWSFQVPKYQEVLVRDLPRDSMIRVFADQPLEFTPGTRMIYSNSGYYLLGQIIEAVSGQTYAEHLQRTIFEPLGMRESGDCAVDDMEDRASGYRPGPDGGFLPAEEFNRRWGFSAGGLCSSAEDLLTWMRALHGGRVLGEPSYRELVTPISLSHGHRLRYANGLHVMRDAGGHPMLRHGGAIPGFLSEARYYPEADLYLIVLTNTFGPPGAEALADVLARRVLGAAAPPEVLSYPGDPTLLAGRYVGRGRNEQLTVTIASSDAGLVARIGEDGRPMPISFSGDGVWSGGPYQFRFDRTDRAPTELHLDEASGHYVLMRESR